MAARSYRNYVHLEHSLVWWLRNECRGFAGIESTPQAHNVRSQQRYVFPTNQFV